MWASIISDLTEADCVGGGWPIGCHQHKEHQYLADRPGVIGLRSPEGMYLVPCFDDANVSGGCQEQWYVALCWVARIS